MCNHLHIFIVWIQTLDFPLGFAGGCRPPAPPGPAVKGTGQKNNMKENEPHLGLSLRLCGEAFVACATIYIFFIVWIQALDFPLRFAGGWRPPAPPGPAVKEMTRGPGQLNLLCKNAIFKGGPGNLCGGAHGPARKKAK